MWNAITAGFISNVIFLLFSVAGAYLIVMILRRKRLYRFYGINETRKVTIYISHFNIQLGGAVDAYGQMRSFTGQAIPHKEMEGAMRLREKFSLPFPGLKSQHGILASFRLSDINCEIIPSPFSEVQVQLDHTIICIGSPGYNTASNVLQKNIQQKVIFARDGSSFNIDGLPSIVNPGQGVLARFTNRGVSYFYLAGLSEYGTLSAIVYLRKHWVSLHKTYKGSTNFYVICEASGSDLESVSAITQNSLVVK